MKLRRQGEILYCGEKKEWETLILKRKRCHPNEPEVYFFRAPLGMLGLGEPAEPIRAKELGSFSDR